MREVTVSVACATGTERKKVDSIRSHPRNMQQLYFKVTGESANAVSDMHKLQYAVLTLLTLNGSCREGTSTVVLEYSNCPSLYFSSSKYCPHQRKKKA